MSRNTSCRLCHDHFGGIAEEYVDGPHCSDICTDCMAKLATPETLRSLASWFDSPHRTSRNITIDQCPERATPGMLFRAIASAIDTD